MFEGILDFFWVVFVICVALEIFFDVPAFKILRTKVRELFLSKGEGGGDDDRA